MMMSQNKKSVNLMRINNGFTLVELIIALLILAIIAAISIPITLNFIDSSRMDNVKMTAKNIMNAVQNEFNQLAVDGELWYSQSKRRGIILNRDRKNYGEDLYDESGNKTEFIKGIMDISKTVPCDTILNKIGTLDEQISLLYVCAGNAYYYEFLSQNDADRKKMYTAYVIIFQIEDDNHIYFYDGREVSNEWPFKTPSESNNMETGENFTDFDGSNKRWDYGLRFRLKNNDQVLLQLYALKIDSTKGNCAENWNKTVLGK